MQIKRASSMHTTLIRKSDKTYLEMIRPLPYPHCFQIICPFIPWEMHA